MNSMKVVLDTNILLVSLPSKSKYRPIFDSLLNGKIHIAITNEIILEYLEIIEQKTNATIAGNVVQLLLNLENVIKVEVHFKWGLIEQDYDDNKFVDCAISAGTDFIVTNDKHFKILKNISFPKVDTISIDKFLQKITTNNTD